MAIVGSPGRSLSRRPVGVVLAGGRSRRMGHDKADLVPPGESRSLLRQAVARLTAVIDEVVVADGGRQRLGDVDSVADGRGRGPAAGVLGAAAARPDRDLLVLACDLPLVADSVLVTLARTAGVDALVPFTDRGPEPLCARYAPRFLEHLARRVDRGRFDLAGLLVAPPSSLRVERLECEPEQFLNLNRPADVDRLAALRHSLLRGRSTSR